MCDKGTDDAGNQRNIVHDTNAYHLHRKDRSRHRGAKQCGESSTHAAHDHHMLVLFVKAEQTAERVSDAAAHLQCSPLTTGRTAEQMRDQGGDKNQRSHAKRQFIPGVNRGDDQIGPGILLIVEQMI